jgi:DNA-binding GntR family transcriptional regulator
MATVELEPLRITTRHDGCYDVLKAAILDLTLPPGAPLQEGEVAARLGVSKTPVREALAKLAGENLITTRPGAQSYVAGLSADSIRDNYEIRIILECASIRRVAHTFSDREIGELAGCVQRAGDALNIEDWRIFGSNNDQFHLLLIRKNPNRQLQGIMDQLFDHVRRVRSAIYRAQQEIYDYRFSHEGIQNHRDILEAVKARNGERAADLIESDIQKFLTAMALPTVAVALDKLNYRNQLVEDGRAQR